MKSFLRFMVSTGGRGLRIVAGLIVIAIGAFLLSTVNWILIIIGIVPLAAGIFDFCIFAPLMGFGFSGRKIRTQINNP